MDTLDGQDTGLGKSPIGTLKKTFPIWCPECPKCPAVLRRMAKPNRYLEDAGRFYDHRSSGRSSGRSRQTTLQVPLSARSRHAAVPGTNPRRFASSRAVTRSETSFPTKGM